jgi:hypothetical protein
MNIDPPTTALLLIDEINDFEFAESAAMLILF